MPRKRKSSPAEDLIDLVALMPWWAGVCLAAVLYMSLHAVAAQPLPAAQGTQAVGQMATAAIWRGLASMAQYALPLISLIGALASAVRRNRRDGLFEAGSSPEGTAAVQAMTWQEFELLVGEAFRRRGYRVQETGGRGADGGVDLILARGADRFFVQCKQWKALRVGVSTVCELYGVMAAEGAAGGFVVTSGRFTREAERFADGRTITLLDGAALQQLLREARSALASNMRPANLQPAAQARLEPPGPLEPPVAAQAIVPAAEATSTQPGPVTCPRCAKSMVLRVARRGASAGQILLGLLSIHRGLPGRPAGMKRSMQVMRGRGPRHGPAQNTEYTGTSTRKQ